MILALSANEGATTYTATEVVLEAAEDGLIRVPEDGQATSPEVYQSFVSNFVTEVISSFSRYDSLVPGSGMSGRMARRLGAVQTGPGNSSR